MTPSAVPHGLHDHFPHTWSATLLSAPPLIAPAQHFIYPQQVPGEEDALARGALLLQVRPAHSSPFLATCALGFRDPNLPNGVWSCPGETMLLAVAGGYAYRIDTARPERCDLLEQRPVTALLAVPAMNLLLLAGFHDILALGPEGMHWRTGRLSWEGLTMLSVQGTALHGTGWDMFSDRDLPFTLDLQTGEHTGGGYNTPIR